MSANEEHLTASTIAPRTIGPLTIAPYSRASDLQALEERWAHNQPARDGLLVVLVHVILILPAAVKETELVIDVLVERATNHSAEISDVTVGTPTGAIRCKH